MFIEKMIIGMIFLENLSGFIIIVKVVGDSVSYGFEVFFSFMVYLSISLGVLNLLFILVLDGGYLMFYLVEMVKGSLVFEKV